MSKRYKGAILSSTPPTTSTTSASGVWTEQQFMQGVATGSWPALAGAPTIGTATAGALNASVTFTAPTYTGSGITGYTVTSSPGGITGTGASSPITVSGLTAGTAYTFTVTATTVAGQSSPSAASNSVTPSALYIENVFNTYLYTGTGSGTSQTITNGINLSTNGGLVWVKCRGAAFNNALVDTARGANQTLYSNDTVSNQDYSASGTVKNFSTTGFAVGTNNLTNADAGSGGTFVSWTFQKQPKFFDIVTYTGNGTVATTTGAATNYNRTISHNLGSSPGCYIVKRTDSTGNWLVAHIGASGIQLDLNTTAASSGATNQVFATSTTFSPGTNRDLAAGGTSFNYWNQNGATYVAYLFAHNAGGFGLTSTDNAISCGSFTSTGSVLSVNLGYEPQWLLFKPSSGAGAWELIDNMRGFTVDRNGTTVELQANTSNAEAAYGIVGPTSTGFTFDNGGSGTTYIYIAIRRGPMAIPTTGTSVFTPQIYTGNGTSNRSLTGFGFSPDFVIQQLRTANTYNSAVADRLRGVNNTGATIGTPMLRTNTTEVEGYSGANNSDIQLLDMGGITVGPNSFSWSNGSGYSNVLWNFKRAPGFFDEVCYSGTGSATTVTHNLGVAPELMIVKQRSPNVRDWAVYSTTIGAGNYLRLNGTDASTANSTYWNSTAPTATVFTVGTQADVNQSSSTFVAYLFATCAGVSKVGSYTGTGATQTISCGFTGGARFVLIKRTNLTGDWYVWDTARGMASGTDPYLLLDTLAAEVNTNSVYTTTGGFQIVSTAAGINASGSTYIYLAIA